MKALWGKAKNINPFVFQIISETKEKEVKQEVLLWDHFWSTTEVTYCSKAEGLCFFSTLCMPSNPKLHFLSLKISTFGGKCPKITKSRLRMFSWNVRRAEAKFPGRGELAQSPLLMAITPHHWVRNNPNFTPGQHHWLQRCSPGWSRFTWEAVGAG